MPLTIEKNGFTDIVRLAADIGQQLVVAGFVARFPTAGLTATTSLFTLEAGPTVDPLAATQPWRIRFEADATGIMVSAGTDLQLPDDGTNTKDSGGSSSETRWSGFMGTVGTATTQERWMTRKKLLELTSGSTPPGDPGASPFSYRLSVSNHGIALMIWAESRDHIGSSFCWLCVQRPVSNTDGSTLITGKSPVFAVYSLDGGGFADSGGVGIPAGPFDNGAAPSEGIRRFVVREIDVLRPSPSVSAVRHTSDSTAIINSAQQTAISENNRYIITFPNGLNTQRYAYPHELDMIAYTSADVISQYSEVQLSVYGEGSPRKYRALNANGVNNTGMRILFLTQGAGIA